MRKDLKMHAAGAIGLMAYAAAIVAAYTWGGPGPAAAVATTLGGLGLEGYQWVRKEGVPAWDDALVTAAPGWVVWMAVAGMQ